MPTFIGYNYKGQIQSIINAPNIKMANSYWQGKGILPHSHTTLKRLLEGRGPNTLIIPILETITIIDPRRGTTSDVKILVVK